LCAFGGECTCNMVAHKSGSACEEYPHRESSV
jgi:hypothetical protein